MLTFTLASLLTLYFRGQYEKSKQKIRGLSEELSVVETDVLNVINAQKNFLIHEPINPEFFQTGKSYYAELNDSLSKKVSDKLIYLSYNDLIKELKMEKEFYRLDKSFHRINLKFNELATTIWNRGYKDYGIEGKMREYAHTLEDNYTDCLDAADILMLRRHEKDFIIRREEKYVLRFEYQIELVKYKLLIDNSINEEKKAKVEKLLQAYWLTFKDLVTTEKKIGLREANGLKSQVDTTGQIFIEELKLLKKRIFVQQEQMLSRLKRSFIVGITIFFLCCIWASVRISKNMSNRIKTLSLSLNNFVDSNFKETTDFTEKNGLDEVGVLARNFKVLQDEIVIHFGLYKTKVERRTNEILQQKEELEIKQEIIEQKNKDILDSIKYAQKIQESILPEDRFLDQLLKDHFIYFLPKDIVSGDFYWVERAKEKVFIAVADCTGHGVPGAFMSIMGNNFMNQAINEKKLVETDQILNYLNIAISSTLGQNLSNNGSDQQLLKVQDGMDLALISIDFSKNELAFSGANRPLVIVRGNDLIELKGNRFAVGGSSYGEIKKFSSELKQLQSGDNIYLFSDGYADQFGGDANKKFKYGKLKELLFSIRREEPELQKAIIHQTLKVWKGNREQVDDICILGIRI